jgi:hypothetical protein
MELPEQILAFYPELTWADLDGPYIRLQNDTDGLGDYIKVWAHPTLAHPPFGYDPHVPQEETK